MALTVTGWAAILTGSWSPLLIFGPQTLVSAQVGLHQLFDLGVEENAPGNLLCGAVPGSRLEWPIRPGSAQLLGKSL